MLLRGAVRHAEKAGDLHAVAMALTHLGRISVLRDEPRAAAGLPGALDAARTHVAAVDNPVLARDLSG